jgi:glycosyltransferase involved in cell wall biosynthesis
MRISIALATYNGERYLLEQLDSFRRQTLQPDELVVCDDCSTDNTLAILEDFSRLSGFTVRIFRNEVNLGHVRNFERALSLCEGDYIFLSDQDDTWAPNKLEAVFAEFEKNPMVDVIVNDATYVDVALVSMGTTVLERVLSVGGEKYGHVAGACTAISKRFRNFVVPFPESVCPHHDVYIHRWANLLGIRLLLERSLQTWRIHGGNSTTLNEMTGPELESTASRYVKYKNADTRAAYLSVAGEYREMLRLLRLRLPALEQMPGAQGMAAISVRIEAVIAAYQHRATLCDARWIRRKGLAFRMLVNGDYRYFKGLYSFAKDLLR